MAGQGFRLVPQQVPKLQTKYRRIVTDLPVPESVPILENVARYESVAMHGQMPVVWDAAEGFLVRDRWGNQWLDFTSTIFVANAGHSNPRIVGALREQLAKPLVHTYTYVTEIRSRYLQELIERTPPQFEKAFLLSAGTEATECALKLMRMNGWKTGKRRPGILAFEGNWHGRTMGAQMLSYNPKQKEWIGYLDPNIHHLPFPYPWRPAAMTDPRGYFQRSLTELFAREGLDPSKDLCGVMLETFQGWGAVMYPPAFVQEVEAFSRQHGLLMAFDEMQAGFGRTGKLFGYMHYGVEPDLLCCGKGASSSLPLSIVLGPRRVMDLPEIGSMSSTHSANPLVCAAGLANLQAILDDGLLENAAGLGALFHDRLNDIRRRHSALMSHVCGKGLIAGLVFANPSGTPLVSLCDRICERAMQRGLLVVHTGRESIKLAPPLCITEEALLDGLDVLESCIRDEGGL